LSKNNSRGDRLFVTRKKKKSKVFLGGRTIKGGRESPDRPEAPCGRGNGPQKEVFAPRKEKEVLPILLKKPRSGRKGGISSKREESGAKSPAGLQESFIKT